MDVKELLSKIKPQEKGKSDKFSWNLYRYLSKFPDYCNVYAANWDNWHGNGDYHPHDMDQELIIGRVDDDWISGKMIREVMWNSRARPVCYTNNFQKTDITEWFWKNYLSVGRCLILRDSSHEWVQINQNARKCAYCGKHEQREVRSIIQRERKEIWA